MGIRCDYFPRMVVNLSIRAGDRREDLGGNTNRIVREGLPISVDSIQRCELFNKEMYDSCIYTWK